MSCLRQVPLDYLLHGEDRGTDREPPKAFGLEDIDTKYHIASLNVKPLVAA